jgi:hypothetical protein
MSNGGKKGKWIFRTFTVPCKGQEWNGANRTEHIFFSYSKERIYRTGTFSIFTFLAYLVLDLQTFLLNALSLNEPPKFILDNS